MTDDFFEIPKKELLQGIRYCLANISTLLDQSQKACQKFSDNAIALGLYTFAIEEFGKLLYMLEAYKIEKGIYKIPKNIFSGRESHNIKFKKALEKLPTECILPQYGIEVHTNMSPEDIVIPVNPHGESITIGGGLTGTFSIETDNPIDLVTRMGCFYLDWDNTNNTWKAKPKVLDEGMIKSITKLGLITKQISLKFENES